MLKGHPRSVVAATDALVPVAARGFEPNAMGARVASVLQQLPHEDPRITPVSFGFKARTL
jgi:hypothetical protein